MSWIPKRPENPDPVAPRRDNLRRGPSIMAMNGSPTGGKTRLDAIAYRVRFTLAIVLSFLAWMTVIGLGTAGFSAQVTWRRSNIVPQEVVGFAAAFAVAGTIAGFTASATSGRRRWTLAFGAISLVTLAASVGFLRWWIFHSTAPNTTWGGRVWNSRLAIVKAGVVFGAISGLVISGVVLMVAVVERHTKRWQFGVIVAIVTAVLGMGVLPLAVSYLSDLIILYSGPNYRYLYERSMAGTAVGAGTGALIGAVVIGMIARSFAAAEPARQRQTELNAESHFGGPVA
jgi:hypothetical protein